MKKFSLLLAGLLLAVGLVAQDNCGLYRFRNYTISDTASLDVIGGDTFLLVSKYPQEMPEQGKTPWDRLDFQKKQTAFAEAVRDYFFEGNDSVDFASHKNRVRNWFHAPMMDGGYAGREPMHGMVMDRTSYAEDFQNSDIGKFRNYSITYYNDIAAYTLGQVWCDPKKPDASKSAFEEGALFFTLTFTTADSSIFPFLNSPYKREALIEQKTLVPIDDKRVDELRLFSAHFGLRHPKSPTGWVMGSYIFDGDAGEDTRSRLVPANLQWGNDPGVTPAAVRKGEAEIQESWYNTAVYDTSNMAGSIMKRTGFGGRAQRPLGSPESSMLSELMAATSPAGPIIPPAGIDMDSTMKYYANDINEIPRDSTAMPTMSLELRTGIRNLAMMGDSTLIAEINRELEESLGFFPPERGADVEEEEEVIDFDEGLEGRNLYTFIGFVVLVVAIGVTLVLNILKK